MAAPLRPTKAFYSHRLDCAHRFASSTPRCNDVQHDRTQPSPTNNNNNNNNNSNTPAVAAAAGPATTSFDSAASSAAGSDPGAVPVEALAELDKQRRELAKQEAAMKRQRAKIKLREAAARELELKAKEQEAMMAEYLASQKSSLDKRHQAVSAKEERLARKLHEATKAMASTRGAAGTASSSSGRPHPYGSPQRPPKGLRKSGSRRGGRPGSAGRSPRSKNAAAFGRLLTLGSKGVHWKQVTAMSARDAGLS